MFVKVFIQVYTCYIYVYMNEYVCEYELYEYI